MPNIIDAVNFMIKIANDDSHGYDQVHRNSPDYDCSSLVATALNKAGFNVSPYSWTGNLAEQLRACGFVKCSRPWKAGDIHLNETHHVCMSINSSQIAQASINEKGTVSGGKTGDQTGREIWITNYYEYKHGWDSHWRYVGANSGANTDEKLVVDGWWGVKTTKKAQKEFGCKIVDGIVSNQPLYMRDKNLGLESSSWEWVENPTDNSNLIVAMQKWLGIEETGHISDSFIISLQKKLGTVADGYVSSPSDMVKALQRYLNSK